MSALVINDLRFELRRSSARRSMEIIVDRTGELVLSAPPAVDETKLRDFVQRKRMWVYRQLARQAALGQQARRKVFVDGEGFPYLGRSYRLRLVDESDAAVKLVGGRFVMPQALAKDGRDHLVRWYCGRARPWLEDKVSEYAARIEVAPAGVRVQDLGYRWGSCGKGGWLYFHWKTILLPARIAEYVVVHEMAHLHEPHHTPEYWRRVEFSGFLFSSFFVDFFRGSSEDLAAGRFFKFYELALGPAMVAFGGLLAWISLGFLIVWAGRPLRRIPFWVKAGCVGGAVVGLFWSQSRLLVLAPIACATALLLRAALHADSQGTAPTCEPTESLV